MKRLSALLVIAVFFLRASALVIQFHSYGESCAGNDGGIIADVSGGVEPYTYDWSNGSTEPMLGGLATGYYTLTVTDDLGAQANATCFVNVWTDTDLVLDAYSTTEGLAACAGECNGGFRIHLPRVMGMYNMNTVPSLSYVELGEDEPVGEDFWATYEFVGACEGTTVTLTVSHPGCNLGQVDVLIDPIVPPVASPGQITGSCNGADDGTVMGLVTVSTAEHWLVIADDGAGTNVVPQGGINFSYGSSPLQLLNLHPGDWQLQMTSTEVFGSAQSPCVVYFPFTIPDLGSACATVSGTVHFETDVDCVQDGGEVGIPGRMLRITPGPMYGITAADGSYAVDLPYGTYDLEQLDINAVQLCPPAAPVSFTVGSGSNATVDLSDSLLTPFDMHLWTYTSICRVGFPYQHSVHLWNSNGHPGENITVTLDHDPLFTFISASPAPSVNTPGHIEWTLPTLLPFAQEYFSVYLQVPPDPGLMGTLHTVSASATSTTPEANTANNSTSYDYPVLASYDPNDKQARTSSGQNDAVYLMDVDEWIDYTIRFQNTGTDTAFNITLRDTLSPMLDPATLEVLGASHAYTPSLHAGNELVFSFANILLPDSNVNEPLSHGYIAYRVRPFPTAPIGSTIDNTADIYFDFNDPVRTNIASLDIGITTGVNTNSTPLLTLAPVPVSDRLTLRNDGTPILHSTVLSADGRVLLRNDAALSIDVSALPHGAYLLHAQFVDGRSAVARFTK